MVIYLRWKERTIFFDADTERAETEYFREQSAEQRGRVLKDSFTRTNIKKRAEQKSAR